MTAQIGCIVEGHGDAEAVPLLIRRIGETLNPPVLPHILSPVRTPRSTLVKPRELERAIELVARRLDGNGAVLVLVDSDDDCPAQLGPQLLQRACSARADLPIAVVLAKYEYEAWFLAAAESLRGQRGLPEDLASPFEPESIRDAKGWLRDRMPKGQKYVETLHQPAFTARLLLDSARKADSFDKCYREIVRLLMA